MYICRYYRGIVSYGILCRGFCGMAHHCYLEDVVCGVEWNVIDDAVMRCGTLERLHERAHRAPRHLICLSNCGESVEIALYATK